MSAPSIVSQSSLVAPRSWPSIFFHASGATIARVSPVSATSSPNPPGSQWKLDSPARPPRTTIVIAAGVGLEVEVDAARASRTR